MAYSVDLPAAARRTLDGAEKLLTQQRDDVSAYLFGLAAECAVKELARKLPGGRDDEIFYAHFPELRALLRDRLSGRRATPLVAIIRDDGFLNGWHIAMRYAPADEVRTRPIERWAQAARDVVNLIGAL